MTGGSPWIIASREVASHVPGMAAVETVPIFFAKPNAEVGRRLAEVGAVKEAMIARVAQLGWATSELMRRINELRRGADISPAEIIAFLDAELAKKRAGGAD